MGIFNKKQAQKAEQDRIDLQKKLREEREGAEQKKDAEPDLAVSSDKPAEETVSENNVESSIESQPETEVESSTDNAVETETEQEVEAENVGNSAQNVDEKSEDIEKAEMTQNNDIDEAVAETEQVAENTTESSTSEETETELEAVESDSAEDQKMRDEVASDKVDENATTDGAEKTEQTEIDPKDAVIEDLKTKLAQSLKEVERQRESNRRMHADFDNYRKRNSDHGEDMKFNGIAQVVQSMLDVLDNCTLARKYIQDANSLMGFNMMETQILSGLDRFGLKEIPAENKPFNVKYMSAVETVTTDGDPDMVVEVVKKGYALRDKVIRVCSVKVSKESDKAREQRLAREQAEAKQKEKAEKKESKFKNKSDAKANDEDKKNKTKK